MKSVKNAWMRNIWIDLRKSAPLYLFVAAFFLFLSPVQNVRGAEPSSWDDVFQHSLQNSWEVEDALRSGLKITSRNQKGETPLMLAVELSPIPIITFFLEKGALLEDFDNASRTPLLKALSRNAVVARFLIEKGAIVHYKENVPTQPIHEAVYSGRKELIDLLLQKGAGMEERDKSGRTPLHVAVYGGNPEVIRLCLERKADINATDSRGFTPLRMALEVGNATITALLLNDMNKASDTEKIDHSLLAIADRAGRQDIVDILVQNHFFDDFWKTVYDVKQVDASGATLLHRAVREKRFVSLQNLTNKGFDLNATSSGGSTPLIFAA
ncbi:MAG: ankyrin repeat domain-containing protein [Candidatus Ozemobacteraceae bacterium]